MTIFQISIIAFIALGYAEIFIWLCKTIRVSNDGECHNTGIVQSNDITPDEAAQQTTKRDTSAAAADGFLGGMNHV